MICSSRPEHPHAAHCTKPLTNHDLTSLILHCPTTSSTTSSSACSARFCNRLCLKRSEKVHPWLCPTQDPVSVPLLTFARKHVWMALHALAQCTAWLLLAHQQKQGRQRAGMGSRNSEEEGMREDRSVYNALADLGMEGRVKRGWYVSVSAFCAFPDITSSLSCARAFLPFFFSRLHGVEPDRATWQSAHRAFTQAFVTPPDMVQDSLYVALMYATTWVSHSYCSSMVQTQMPVMPMATHYYTYPLEKETGKWQRN